MASEKCHFHISGDIFHHTIYAALHTWWANKTVKKYFAPHLGDISIANGQKAMCVALVVTWQIGRGWFGPGVARGYHMIRPAGRRSKIEISKKP
jgi:hypothetical protein